MTQCIAHTKGTRLHSSGNPEHHFGPVKIELRAQVIGHCRPCHFQTHLVATRVADSKGVTFFISGYQPIATHSVFPGVGWSIGTEALDTEVPERVVVRRSLAGKRVEHRGAARREVHVQGVAGTCSHDEAEGGGE